MCKMLRTLLCFLFSVVAVLALEETHDAGGMSSLFSMVNGGKRRGGFSRGKIVDGLDLILTPQQARELYDRDGIGRRKRGGTLNYVTFWPEARVYYHIVGGDFEGEELDNLMEAMRIISAHTCVRFLPDLNDNYISIQNGTSGCNSLLGMAGGRQEINLLSGGCRHMGVYLHELGHALGLLHEHQLPTRDRYVKYNRVNVHPGKRSQLDMYSDRVTEMYGQLYDLSSVMHYETSSFSVDGESKTLGVADPFLEKHIGRPMSPRLSFGDVKILNTFYQCGRDCHVDCPEPGYVNEFCRCVTPQSYEAEICQDEPGQTAWCEQKLKNGECSAEKPLFQKRCAKTCDLCPRFLPGQSALKKPQSCADHYVDPAKCQQWAAAGDCSSYPDFMNQYCTKSCGKCQDGHGECPDQWAISTCKRLKEGCTMDGWNSAKKKCPATCGICGQRRQGDCENRKPDAECERRMKVGECEDDAEKMYWDCPKHCNRCFYQAGDCNNSAGQDFLCRRYAVENACVGGMQYTFMRRNCHKACNRCADLLTTTTTTTEAPLTLPPGECRNIYTEVFCVGWLKYMTCDDNKRLRDGCMETCGLCAK